MENQITDVRKCQCKAITVSFDNGATNSMPRKLFTFHFKGTKINGTFVHCDYCVNKYGIDLCGCGSGKKFGKCKENLSECRSPRQELEVQMPNLFDSWRR